MRVYLPGTMALLERLRQEGTVPASTGYAVTEALRAWYLEGDEEELEYAAMTAAARASLRLLALEPELAEDRALRVVLAADVADSRVVPSSAEPEDPGVIEVTGSVALTDIASLHVDEPGARAAVRFALAALPAAAEGDPDAGLAVDAVEDFDLLWYASQELGDLV